MHIVLYLAFFSTNHIFWRFFSTSVPWRASPFILPSCECTIFNQCLIHGSVGFQVTALTSRATMNDLMHASFPMCGLYLKNQLLEVELLGQKTTSSGFETRQNLRFKTQPLLLKPGDAKSLGLGDASLQPLAHLTNLTSPQFYFL